MSSPDIIIAFKLAIKRVSHSSIIFALAALVFLRGRLRLIAGQPLDLIISKAENRLRASFNMHVFRNIPFCRILRGYMRIAKALVSDWRPFGVLQEKIRAQSYTV